MERKLFEVLTLLSTEEYQTAQYLAEKVGVSEKTIRNRIKELNDELKQIGTSILSKHRYGYILKVEDSEAFLNISRETDYEEFPDTVRGRQQFLLNFLLQADDYVKLDDLSDEFFISRNVLSATLKRVEAILRMYDLQIERKPNYGIKIIGIESNKRLCMLSNVYDTVSDTTKENWLMQHLGKLNASHQIQMSELALNSFVKYILVAMHRIQMNHSLVEMADERDIRPAIEFLLVPIIDAIEEEFQIHFNSLERQYICIQFSSRLSSDSYSQYGPNFVITGEIDELVFQMLNRVYEIFALDFRNNLELRMSLNQHLVPMDIRLRYNILVDNPLREEIKKKYTYPYTLAMTACFSLQEHYQKPIPEDEIAYIALIFALATEKRNRTVEKKNIVLVCVSGKSSSQLFKFKYQQAFGDYINRIYECTVSELEEFDFQGRQIDYIFTTVPLNKKYIVPIYEINLFIDPNEILVYRELFENRDKGQFLRYYSSNLFLPNLVAETREEVIQKMCQHLEHYGLIPDDFLESVMKREEMGQTSFGNLVAHPHPAKVLTEESFVSVAVPGASDRVEGTSGSGHLSHVSWFAGG